MRPRCPSPYLRSAVSNPALVWAQASAFSAACSSVFEKAVDAKGIFNAVLAAAAIMQGAVDKQALSNTRSTS